MAVALDQRVSGAVERLDAPNQDPALVAGALDDLARINRLLFGTRLTLACLDELCRQLPAPAPLTLADVGCGGGELSASVARWAERRSQQATMIAFDASPEIATRARERFGSVLDVRVGDIRALPLPDESVDVALCSLLIHHLEPDDAVRGLRELSRVARLGVVVNDLVRSRLGLLGARTVIPTLTRNPVTRHDAVLSVRRAYTRRELHELLAEAGLRPLATRGALGYRVAVAAVRR